MSWTDAQPSRPSGMCSDTMRNSSPAANGEPHVGPDGNYRLKMCDVRVERMHKTLRSDHAGNFSRVMSGIRAKIKGVVALAQHFRIDDSGQCFVYVMRLRGLRELRSCIFSFPEKLLLYPTPGAESRAEISKLASLTGNFCLARVQNREWNQRHSTANRPFA